jgi:hypothetical protein
MEAKTRIILISSKELDPYPLGTLVDTRALHVRKEKSITDAVYLSLYVYTTASVTDSVPHIAVTINPFVDKRVKFTPSGRFSRMGAFLTPGTCKFYTFYKTRRLSPVKTS